MILLDSKFLAPLTSIFLLEKDLDVSTTSTSTVSAQESHEELPANRNMFPTSTTYMTDTTMYPTITTTNTEAKVFPTNLSDTDVLQPTDRREGEGQSYFVQSDRAIVYS